MGNIYLMNYDLIHAEISQFRVLFYKELNYNELWGFAAPPGLQLIVYNKMHLIPSIKNKRILVTTYILIMKLD